MNPLETTPTPPLCAEPAALCAGLSTPHTAPTEGLLESAGGRPSGRIGGMVGRPCHNAGRIGGMVGRPCHNAGGIGGMVGRPCHNAPADRSRPTGLSLGRYAVVLHVLAFVVVLFTVLRLAMAAAFVEWDELSLLALGRMFWVGLQFDLLVGLAFVLPQTLHLTLVSNRRIGGPVSRRFLDAEWLIAFLFIPFVCVVEFIFFDEFQSRLNYIAFEYLVYATEVCCNIWQSYPIVPLVTALVATGGTSFVFFRRRFVAQLESSLPWTRRYSVLAAVLAAIVGLWWTTGMDRMQVSMHRVINQCAGNGLYSFVYYAWTCKFDYEHFYVTIDRDEGYDRVRRRVLDLDDRRHSLSTNPLDRTESSARPQRDFNVVLILEESFGSDFVGALGNPKGLTPRFDALAREGILFDNFYATGNRTARALEAVLTSLPPIPTESILKRDHSERVYTLAHVLAERGYRRLFMTGGSGLFDGVRSFMTANGFDQFIEEDDFEDPAFENAWGVSDEDLFNKALTELDRMEKDGDTFFATILTVSNHHPFTYPDGRISRPSSEQKRENAVQYADWALGDFFAQARSHKFYRNTLFVVMGDHGARVYGRQLFPVKSYRVPVLMILPDGQGKGSRTSTLASSLDIAPTIMGILGGSYRSVFFGRDVLNAPPAKSYALMQHNHDIALLSADHQMVVLGSRKSIEAYRLDPATFDLAQVGEPNRKLMMDAISFYQSANRLYYDRRCYPDVTRAALSE